MKKCLFWLGNHWLVLFLCILIIIDIGCHINHDMFFDENNLIIGFIGTLASIVIIGNLTQVYAIKNDFDKQINEIKDKMDDFRTISNNYDDLSKALNELYIKLNEEKKHG